MLKSKLSGLPMNIASITPGLRPTKTDLVYIYIDMIKEKRGISYPFCFNNLVTK